MNRTDADAGASQDVLFHVAVPALAIGHVLSPYAFAQRSLDLLQQADRALEVGGGDAVAELVAGAAWTRLQDSGGYPVEMILLEAVFERVRRQATPDLPSRFGAVFAWRTLALANRYQVAYHPTGVIHSCRLVAGRRVERDGALLVEVFEHADLKHPQGADLRWVEEQAQRYWRGQHPMTFPEVLVHGTVVVEGIVEVSVDPQGGA